MMKFNYLILTVLAAGLVLSALVGCHAKPYDYEPTAGEMKAGPGVFTGESGELTIYDSKKGGLLGKESAETSGENTADASAEATTAAGTQAGTEPAVTSEEAMEFQQFQQWKKEKEQFHNYQQWKKSVKGSAEFKEFQEYQEYQEWKKTAKDPADLKEFQEWKEFKAYQEWKKGRQ